MSTKSTKSKIICKTKVQVQRKRDTEPTTNVVTRRKKPVSPLTNTNDNTHNCQQVTPTKNSTSPQEKLIQEPRSSDSNMPMQNNSPNESFLSISERLSRSVECMSLNNNIIELKEENDRLTSEVLSTQKEMENTILENNELKRKISKLTNEVVALKGLCQTSTSSNTTPKSHRTRRNPIFDKQSASIYDSPSPQSEKSHDLLYLQYKITQLTNQLLEAKKEIALLTEEIKLLERKLKDTSHTSHDKEIEDSNINKRNTDDSYVEGTLAGQETNARQKIRKMCIISSNKSNSVLKIAENTFQDSQIIHYLTPNAGINTLTEDLELKLKNYTLQDYCIILIGQDDFLSTNNYFDTIITLRKRLQTLEYTNIILCLPTYRCKKFSAVFNWRVETFNNLLYLDILSNNYAYLVDSNLQLSYDDRMFSYVNGNVNNQGMKSIFDNVKYLVDDLIKYNNEYDILINDSNEKTDQSNMTKSNSDFFLDSQH